MKDREEKHRRLTITYVDNIGGLEAVDVAIH